MGKEIHVQNLLKQRETKPKVKEEVKDDDGNIIKTLPSGKKAVIKPILGEDIRFATRIADGNGEMLMPALISVTTTIDGKEVFPDEVDKMDGFDVLALMTYFNRVGENF